MIPSITTVSGKLLGPDGCRAVRTGSGKSILPRVARDTPGCRDYIPQAGLILSDRVCGAGTNAVSLVEDSATTGRPKRYTLPMADDILENARRRAKNADTSIRTAVLLRIARAESAGDLALARGMLLEGLDTVQKLPARRTAAVYSFFPRTKSHMLRATLSELPGQHRTDLAELRFSMAE